MVDRKKIDNFAPGYNSHILKVEIRQKKEKNTKTGLFEYCLLFGIIPYYYYSFLSERLMYMFMY